MHDHANSTTDTFEHGALHLVLLDYEKRIMQFKLKYSAMLRAVLHINDTDTTQPMPQMTILYVLASTAEKMIAHVTDNSTHLRALI